MKLVVKARLTAAVLIGVLVSVAQYFNQVRQIRSGRDAFMAAQAAHYDKLLIPMNHPIQTRVFATAISMALVYGLYELIALALLVAISSTSASPWDGN